MVKLLNLVTAKSKQDKYCLILTELASNIHVISLFYLAIVQILSNSLNKVDIDLRTTLYN